MDTEYLLRVLYLYRYSDAISGFDSRCRNRQPNDVFVIVYLGIREKIFDTNVTVRAACHESGWQVKSGDGDGAVIRPMDECI